MKSRKCFGKPKLLSRLAVLLFLSCCKRFPPPRHPESRLLIWKQMGIRFTGYLPALDSTMVGEWSPSEPTARSIRKHLSGFIPLYSPKALQCQTFCSTITPTPGRWRLRYGESSSMETLTLANTSLSPKAPNAERALVDPPFSLLQPLVIPLIFSTIPASVWLHTLTSTSCLLIPWESSNSFHHSLCPPVSHHFLLQPSLGTMTIHLVVQVENLRITLGSSHSLTPHVSNPAAPPHLW